MYYESDIGDIKSVNCIVFIERMRDRWTEKKGVYMCEYDGVKVQEKKCKNKWTRDIEIWYRLH